MKILQTVSLSLALATSTTAAFAGKPPKKPAASTVEPALVKQFLAFFDKFVDTAVADKDKCDKMATDLGHHLDANHALLAKAKQVKDAGKQLPKAAMDHLEAATRRLIPAMQKCGNDPKVRAVFGRLDFGSPHGHH